MAKAKTETASNAVVANSPETQAKANSGKPAEPTVTEMTTALKDPKGKPVVMKVITR